MTVVRINVDHREHALIECLSTLFDNIDASPLAYGDVTISIDDPQHQLVFERKTIQDLAASIKDGRYREQKLRLLANTRRCDLTYIIEGEWTFLPSDSTVSGMTREALSGAIINTAFRDGIRVVHTRDVYDTSAFLHGLVTRILKNPAAYCNDNEDPPTQSAYEIASIQARRSKRGSSTSVFVTQLSMIPGVSITLANAIAQQYGNTMKDLMAALVALPTHKERVKRLQQLPHLGKKTAHQLLESLGFVVGDDSS